MKYQGFFRDWKIGLHTAEKGKFCVWICNGFWFFDDERNPLISGQETLLTHIGLFDRWRLWRELKREKERRFAALAEEAKAKHP